MTTILQVFTYIAIFAAIVMVSVFDIGGEATKAFIFAGAGLAAITLFLFLDWRNGRL